MDYMQKYWIDIDEVITEWQSITSIITPIAQSIKSEVVDILRRRHMTPKSIQDGVQVSFSQTEMDTLQSFINTILQEIKDTGIPVGWITTLSNILLFRKFKFITAQNNVNNLYYMEVEILKKYLKNCK